MQTVNTTSWPTAEHYLGKVDADVVLIQEHKATTKEIQQALAYKRLHYREHAASASLTHETDGRCRSAGVAIAIRPGMGLYAYPDP